MMKRKQYSTPITRVLILGKKLILCQSKSVPIDEEEEYDSGKYTIF